MADLLALYNELTTDPLGRGYDGMSAASAASNLNIVDRTRNRETMEAYEVMNAIAVPEFLALSSASRQIVWDILHNGMVNPFGVEADLFIQVFGAGASTLQTLADLRVDDVSRANEIGFGPVSEGQVIKARALGGE